MIAQAPCVIAPRCLIVLIRVLVALFNKHGLFFGCFQLIGIPVVGYSVGVLSSGIFFFCDAWSIVASHHSRVADMSRSLG